MIYLALRQRQEATRQSQQLNASRFVRFNISRWYAPIIGQFPTRASAFNRLPYRVCFFYAPIWVIFIQNQSKVLF